MVSLCGLLVAAPAAAQEPSSGVAPATVEPAQPTPPDAGAAPTPAEPAQPEPPAAGATQTPSDEAAAEPEGMATVLSPPQGAPPAARGPEEAEAPPRYARAEERPRGWRMPRETVRRPLTLPQGVLRFDSTIALSVAPVAFGSRLYMSGYAAMAAGLFDDLEIGATPIGITWIPLGYAFDDPYVYARVRALSGDVQLAFRAGTTIPGLAQVGVAQLDLGAELALLLAPIFRIDTGLDYGVLIASPVHQRVGIPVRATIQAGIAAFGLTLGVYVFNDFDDVDVPLLARVVITFRGYQGPHGEWSLEGGFTDLEHAENAWTLQSRFTFFAYL